MSEIMTRQEAAEIVRTFREAMDTPITEHREILLGALDMAIEELEKDPKSVIYLCKYHKEGHECKHTSRIEDALNFKEVAPGKWVEVVQATVPILIHHSGKTFPGYKDIARKLIFASAISEELAEQRFGWTWEEAEEQKLGGE